MIMIISWWVYLCHPPNKFCTTNLLDSFEQVQNLLGSFGQILCLSFRIVQQKHKNCPTKTQKSINLPYVQQKVQIPSIVQHIQHVFCVCPTNLLDTFVDKFVGQHIQNVQQRILNTYFIISIQQLVRSGYH